MARETLAERLRQEHHRLIGALQALRQTLLDRDRAGAIETLDRLDRLAGPHIRFEEEWLFPALGSRLDDRRLHDLTREHVDVADIIRLIRVKLAAPDIQGDEYLALAATLAPFFAHTVTCDGLNVLITHCDDAGQTRLHKALDDEMARPLLLTEYRTR